ncbi:MAG TPA: nicotinamide riboside transporter PnuC [Pseudidiomarina sp.]|nr:nicotinamide riboside transporter PnuC [Pseudidiomarina sp.]
MQWLLEQLALSSPWELLAVILAVIYLTFAAHQSLWCWPAAAISCAIYIVVMFNAQLYMYATLNVIYVGMAGYGYWQWKQLSAPAPVASIELRWRGHSKLILLWSVVAALVAMLLLRYTDAEAVWLDTYLAVFSVVATWLLARKKFATWYYWLVIDCAYVYLFFLQGFVATALLHVIYVILVFYAMWQWQRDALK